MRLAAFLKAFDKLVNLVRFHLLLFPLTLIRNYFTETQIAAALASLSTETRHPVPRHPTTLSSPPKACHPVAKRRDLHVRPHIVTMSEVTEAGVIVHARTDGDL